ncbi:hypothetical protein DMH04_08905 [Kibdelosporangium aridum]|uniref:DUF2382 domain-containing protein n=1 Tax=Kibdelosporangium aridum TaxID=2030 RepID=A0A428ZIP6_KIBAR|nr:hypothetical protein [Kibdelosporangium aridum]RSM87840.1 hypothetical protein DMH04_08905 [Kibdelosporangium aridum]
MPDYFDRLLAKASDAPGPVPQARPRLPHLFERPQHVPELEQYEEIETPGVRAAVPTPLTPLVPGRAHDKTPVEQVHTGPSREEVRTEVRQDVTRSVEIVQAVHRIEERVELRRDAELVPVHLPPPPLTSIERPEPVITSTAANQSTVEVRPPASAADPTVSSQERRAEQAQVHSPRAERAVQVTIGRLEVNVAGPDRATPRARPSRAAPVVSLERYLAGEDGRHE